MIYKFITIILYIYYTFIRRAKIVGRENIPNEGPVLIFANHPSIQDIFIIAAYVKRKVHYMAKGELFRNPILAALLKALGAFPISRGKGDVGSIKNVYRLLEEGKIVGIFPEGTRTLKKNPKMNKGGAAMLALHSKAPILPVAVEWNKTLFSRPRLVFGDTYIMLPEEEDKRIPKEKFVLLTRSIMDDIYGLIGQ